MNDIAKKVYSSNNGDREMEFRSPDDREDVEFNGTDLGEISKIFLLTPLVKFVALDGSLIFLSIS